MGDTGVAVFALLRLPASARFRHHLPDTHALAFVDICRAEGRNISEISKICASAKFALVEFYRRPVVYEAAALTAEMRARLKYYDP